MRRAGKVDANQNETCKALRAAGMTVWITSGMGQGAPDLVVGWRGVNVLIELKDGAKPPSKQMLTKDEEHFRDTWAGQLCVVRTPTEAVLAVIAEAQKQGRIAAQPQTILEQNRIEN